MNGEILSNVVSVTEKLPKVALPYGWYIGSWGGYGITVKIKSREYHIKVKEGIRTTSAPVIVMVKKEGISYRLLDN